jgi:lipid A 3-O-deacylase
MNWRLVTVAILGIGATNVNAQTRSFHFYVENDAQTGSDTGYTNGIRLAWTLGSTEPRLRGLAALGLPWLLTRTPVGKYLGLVPGNHERTCGPAQVRGDREDGRCHMLLLGVSHLLYTPDSLLDTNVQPQDRPFAGFLYVTIGSSFLDSPRARLDQHSVPVMAQLSNEIIVGVTGGPSFGREIQSLAHWTLATSAERPRGWHNQLGTTVHVALLTQLAFRPRGWEVCRNRRVGCNGGIDERRLFDVTPRLETVFGTQMIRTSGGLVARLGYNFPDQVGVGRIPVTVSDERGGVSDRDRSLNERLFPGPQWSYLFAALDSRYVPHNAFLTGSWPDGGENGWRNIRQIEPRSRLQETAVGAAFGNKSMSFAGQMVWRTPEYDVRGAAPFSGFHRYLAVQLTIHGLSQ